MNQIELPPAPAHCTGLVKAWSQPIVIPTYSPCDADPNPMFLESRVYQGSSGRVYPLPFIDRIESQARPREWQALHVENEFVRLLILPEIGGRIHVGLDKRNGYDFFYRQNVIKPALVGLAGPWISGGVEFNWPQHHRPATFMLVNTEIEREADGSVTIWCSDHDPMERMRGTHGVCLHPGCALVELKVRLFNRTAFTQTFLWWANVAVPVNENYQSIFPPDVHYVADHARRAISTFPLCDGTYYGIDYGRRVSAGVPPAQRPSHFIPGGDYAANDLSRYANIPVPTSYMAVSSEYDFVAGYDHGRKAGVVHVADHHISPGKKQWTWGNHEFGYAWDRNLTDSDGPYVELMAGVYTDNQPDFSFLAPFETKTFSQYWFPIREMGGVQQANVNAAVSLQSGDGAITLGLNVTRPFSGAKISLTDRDFHLLAEWIIDLNPATVFYETVRTSALLGGLMVSASDGSEIIRCEPPSQTKALPPELATEPMLPARIKHQDELYLTGVHLQQYRHATRRPEMYWQEALRRDPADHRCNTAMGSFHLRRGELETAKTYLRHAIAALTRRNQNPADGEPYYLLGIVLRFLNDLDGAYAVLYKATWSQALGAAAYMTLAEIDASRRNWERALDHVSRSLVYNSENLNTRSLKAIVLRKLGRSQEAAALLNDSLQMDRLDPWSLHLTGQRPKLPNQQLLDLAFDYARSHLFEESVQVLEQIDHAANDGSVPICLYALASFLDDLGDAKAANEYRARAKKALPTYCCPHRLEEMLLLQEQIHRDAHDSKAFYYLGNLLYDKRRHQEALDCWRQSAHLNPRFATVWRNLGIGCFNILHDEREAQDAFDKAFAADPKDARVLFERDQLWKRLSRPLLTRLPELERFPELVSRRDDISLELATLYNQTNQPAKALALLASRHFQPWEGGEGLAIAQYVRAHLALGRMALQDNLADKAGEHFQQALEIPQNLSEARHVLANQSNTYYWLGEACERQGRSSTAIQWWRRAASHVADFQHMAVQPFSEMTFYTALSFERLGEPAKSKSLAEELAHYARGLSREKREIDYFATSLPTMLLFDDDLNKRRKTTASVLRAQAEFLAGHTARAFGRLRRILKKEPSHEHAFDLLEELPLLAKLQLRIGVNRNV